MTAAAPLDVDVLRHEIQTTYTTVSNEPEREFVFPTGRAWAEDLGYPPEELARVPEASVESFAGVANHFALGSIESGATVLTSVAAQAPTCSSPRGWSARPDGPSGSTPP